MSYVTIIWSVAAACAMLLALIYGLVWIMNRRAWSSLAFTGLALALVASVVVELGMMRATSPEEWGEWVRWASIPVFLRITMTLVFIRLYFGTGNLWLMWSIITIRVGVLIGSFAFDPNFNFSRIDSIEHIVFLGEQITVVGDAQVRPTQWIATSTSLLVGVFVLDATVKLWRTGTRDARRKAILIGGMTFLSAATGSVYTQLMLLGGITAPALLAPPFMLMFGAMAIELSRDTLRASRLARELRDSEARLELAASAAGLALWTWDAGSNKFWVTSRARAMFGFGADEEISLQGIRGLIHPDDHHRTEEQLRQAATSGAESEVTFRIVRRDGATLSILARGRSQADARGQLISIQGVFRDITEQSRALQENEELRRELAHAGRVSVLGTLSSSLAHELSQPLGAILLNAEAAKLLLNRPNPDIEELRQIVDDIYRDDHRAAEVIERLRALLKRRQLEIEPVAVDTLVQDVALLLKSDAIARNVTLDCNGDAAVPAVRGDKVHLSQVLINLIVNAMDAMAGLPAPQRRVTVSTRVDGSERVEVAVSDSGLGIPPDVMPRLFQPFFTTKKGGMGMGLSMSRTIIEAHGGSLSAENTHSGGAVFRVSLPVYS